MFSIIITGHGGFSSGIEKTIELIMGKQNKISFQNYNEGMSLDLFKKNLKKSIFQLGNEDGTLILSDIKGGTPFNTGVLLGQELRRVEVIGGINLPLVILALNLREFSSLEECLLEMIEEGRRELDSFKKSQIKHKNFEGNI